jgi:exonuclease III
MVEALKVRSLNVNGLQVKKKRDLVFKELTKYSSEILMLQETHSCALDERSYKVKWGNNVFFSHGTTQSKGICIIIPKDFKGDCEKNYSDLEGRLLVIKLTINKVEYIVGNIYAPVSSY